MKDLILLIAILSIFGSVALLICLAGANRLEDKNNEDG